MAKNCPFATEAELVTAFLQFVERGNASTNPRAQKWTVYPETAGWDVLLVDPASGVQLGVEAKLSLNVAVLAQALPNHSHWYQTGPDYRAVLVPDGRSQNGIADIASHLGIGILRVRDDRNSWDHRTGKGPYWTCSALPDENSVWCARAWHSWLPLEREKLPDYIPDVQAGVPSPVQLTLWKIKAIKLMIILERRGYVTRKDLKALELSPTRWTGHGGFLQPDVTKGGYVRCSRTPDLRAQHPKNYPEIEADIGEWGKHIDLTNWFERQTTADV